MSLRKEAESFFFFPVFLLRDDVGERRCARNGVRMISSRNYIVWSFDSLFVSIDKNVSRNTEDKLLCNVNHK